MFLFYMVIMDYKESLSNKHILNISKTIENYLSNNDYENAFFMFLIHVKRMNFLDRDDFINYFNKYFIEKYSIMINKS